MSKQTRNRVGVRQVTDADIMAMASSDASVDPEIAERAGSPDKVEAVKAENAPPKVKTFTDDGRAWYEADKYGIREPGMFGPRDQVAINHDALVRHAQFLGTPLSAEYLENVILGPDPSAPETAVCSVTGRTITQFVRAALITENGDLMRDKEGNVVYRGQFVVTGKPLAVHASVLGDPMYKLRDALGKKKRNKSGRLVADLLPSQSYDQAQARLAGIEGHFSAKAAENQAFKERLGFTMRDARRTDDAGIDRGTFAPRMPRGKSKPRTERRNWTANAE